MTELWFMGFKRHSGFDKTSSVTENLRVMYKNTRLKISANAWRRVGRQAQALANLTADKATERKSRAVADAAFRQLSKIKI